jgi:hypothetical protein
MNPYATRLLERLARATWERIKIGEQLDCSQGEETITDINLLDMKRAGYPGMRIIKTNKPQESQWGIDWEWWIGSDRGALSNGWWRFAIQAKKIDRQGRYNSLRHKIGRRFQFELLKQYAHKNQCIPLYCLYNFVPRDIHTFWHCCTTPYDQPQMGCTVAPIAAIAEVFRKGASKKFEAVHKHPTVLPWRCLVGCYGLLPQRGYAGHPLASKPFTDVAVYDNLPDFLQDTVAGSSDILFPAKFYNKKLAIYPKRIIVIDVEIAATLG